MRVQLARVARRGEPARLRAVERNGSGKNGSERNGSERNGSLRELLPGLGATVLPEVSAEERAEWGGTDAEYGDEGDGDGEEAAEEEAGYDLFEPGLRSAPEAGGGGGGARGGAGGEGGSGGGGAGGVEWCPEFLAPSEALPADAADTASGRAGFLVPKVKFTGLAQTLGQL